MGTWNSRGLRGSTLEEMINRTNEKYREKGLALIQKVPTPITPIKIDKTHHQITLAYFDQKSTVDYIGAVQGIPVCFDAKECDVKTFPLQNVHQLLIFWNRAKEGGRKSFRMEELDPAYFFDTDKGYLVPYLEPLSYDLETETEG